MGRSWRVQVTMSFTKPTSCQMYILQAAISGDEELLLQMQVFHSYISCLHFDSFAATRSTVAASVSDDLGIDLTSTESTGQGDPEEGSLDDGQGEVNANPFFPNSHPFLVSLYEYLQSRHGRSRSEREARQICNDVNRYLYFASPEALRLEFLLDGSKLHQYLKTLEPVVQPSTQNAKLNRIRQGIHFLALNLDAAGLFEVQRVEGLIKNWSAVLAKSSRVAVRRTTR